MPRHQGSDKRYNKLCPKEGFDEKAFRALAALPLKPETRIPNLPLRLLLTLEEAGADLIWNSVIPIFFSDPIADGKSEIFFQHFLQAKVDPACFQTQDGKEVKVMSI